MSVVKKTKNSPIIKCMFVYVSDCLLKLAGLADGLWVLVKHGCRS